MRALLLSLLYLRIPLSLQQRRTVLDKLTLVVDSRPLRFSIRNVHYSLIVEHMTATVNQLPLQNLRARAEEGDTYRDTYMI